MVTLGFQPLPWVFSYYSEPFSRHQDDTRDPGMQLGGISQMAQAKGLTGTSYQTLFQLCLLLSTAQGGQKHVGQRMEPEVRGKRKGTG